MRNFGIPSRLTITLVAIHVLAGRVAAQSTIWTNPGSGGWTAPGNWSAGLPNQNVDAQINNGGTAVLRGSGAVGEARDVYLGFNVGSSGALSLSRLLGVGGTLSNRNASIGEMGSGTASVGGSSWTSSGFLAVGNGGPGTLSIVGGGVVTSNTGHVSLNPGSDGSTATVDGSGARWVINDTLNVGNSAAGTLNIFNSGTVSSPSGQIGILPGSNGTVNIAGAGSTWTTTNISVGIGGTGTLNITAGGLASMANVLIGIEPGSTGTAVVDGADARLMSTFGGGLLNVGGRGTGELNIRNGGLVSNTFSLLGDPTDSHGTANVDGAGSTWTNTGNLTVGRQGTGTLNITGGGRVSASAVVLAAEQAGRGTVNVSGAGSELAVQGPLTVGIGLNGASMTVSDGGKISAGDLTIAHSIDTVNPNAGSVTLNHAANSTVGRVIVAQNRANGTLIIDGSSLSSADAVIGNFAHSNGTVEVSKSGMWNVNGPLSVGGNATAPGGQGSLTVGDVSTVNVLGSTLTVWPQGSILVDGGSLSMGALNLAGGTFTFASGALHFGAPSMTLGDGLLDMLLGSTHSLPPEKKVSVAGTTTLDASLRIDGGTFATGSLVNSSGAFTFNTGTFELTQQNLVVGNGQLLGPMLALPAGKNLRVANTLQINPEGVVLVDGGNLGSGVIDNRGLISGRGNISSRLNNLTDGELRSLAGSHLRFTNSANNNSGLIELLGGTLEFTQTLTNGPMGLISGHGALITAALTNNGTLAFSGAADLLGDVTNSAGGTIIVSGGGPTTFYDDVVNTGQIRTSPGTFSVFFGSLTGTGSFTGAGTVNIEGDLSPGSSPAIVTFGGNLEFGDQASLEIEIGGLTAGNEFDRVEVAGAAHLDGTLQVALINGFTPTAGNTFDILDWSTISGTFATINLPTLAGLAWDVSQLYSTGQISVVAPSFLAADFDEDGDVDGNDLAEWRTGFGTTGAAVHMDGDADGDVDVDGADFLVWQRQLGSASVSADSAAAVPEPSGVVGGLIALALAVACRHDLSARLRCSVPLRP